MEKEILTSAIVQEFLEDFEKNSITELLEEGKEQNEIFQIAEARGIKLKDRQCLAGFKTVYTFANKANLNKARLPKKELLKALPTLVGTPVDIDHQRNYVVGHYIDYRYIVKDESVVVYGVFYKANFEDEWENAQKLFKSGKLTTSYEIYSPKNKRKVLEDGTFELHDMEIGGGALLFKEKPAFKDARVLEIAKINLAKEVENLVFASKYCSGDIIINGTTPCMHCGKCEHKEVATEEKKVEEKVTPVTVTPVAVAPVVPEPIVIPKIKCANCQHEFDAPKVAISEIKCSECFAIINEKGDLLYPPQIIDFNISCPSCSSRNWRLLKKDESTGEIKCLSCAKKYSIAFSKVEVNHVLNMIQFVHIGHVSCSQCGSFIEYSGTSQVTTYNLKCKKCGLAFVHDITKEQIKKLTKIEEIIEPIKASVSMDDLNEMPEIPSKADELNIDNSAIKEEAKGEVKMEQKPVENIVEVASTPDAKSEVAEVKEVIAETVAPVVASEEAPKVEENPKVEEAKIEEPKAEEKPAEAVAPIVEEAIKVEETPKVETPVEAKIEETPKAEVAPIVEATVETPKVETPIEPKVEVAKEETKEEKKTKKHKEWLRKMKLMKKEKASIIKTLEEKVEFYKANAEEISKRRKELGDAGKNLSDVEVLDNVKFSDAKLVQANLETSSIVGTKKTDEDTYKKYRDEIDAKAQGKIKRTK